jgi:hypothetical protein
LGLVTIGSLGVQTAPDPQNPGQVRISLALGQGAHQLARVGIIMNVGIGVDNSTSEAIISQGNQPPPQQNCTAMVDTGADGLALDTAIVRALSLIRRGVVQNGTAAGVRQANQYAVSLTFPGTSLRSYPLLTATEVDLSSQPFKCLIGRETMANWHFHYNGQTGFISISD